VARPITLFTGQWTDMPIERLAPLAAELGYDGLELACSGDHVDERHRAILPERHLAYQGVDYLRFIHDLGDRIARVHMKDVWWGRGDGRVGTFGGHTSFGDPSRAWDFRSLGRGDVDFEAVAASLGDVGYAGPLSIEWEDARMDRVHGAAEALRYCRELDFPPSEAAFDDAFVRRAG
jgi:sugar phosphate isomerase/epimerase